MNQAVTMADSLTHKVTLREGSAPKKYFFSQVCLSIGI